jgi:hypothetical protein
MKVSAFNALSDAAALGDHVIEAIGIGALARRAAAGAGAGAGADG